MKRKNKHAVKLGKLGGEARARKLSKARRVEIARQGYEASPISILKANYQTTDKIGKNKVSNNSCA